ncbi:hypothetical protein VCV18_003826 [Metarhizium anisopliae]
MGDFQMSLPYPNPSLSQMPSIQNPNISQADQTAPSRARNRHNVSGIRQKVLMASLDTSIVATSLVTISHELNDFANAPWIILAYLLTYMGMLTLGMAYAIHVLPFR